MKKVNTDKFILGERRKKFYLDEYVSKEEVLAAVQKEQTDD